MRKTIKKFKWFEKKLFCLKVILPKIFFLPKKNIKKLIKNDFAKKFFKNLKNYFFAKKILRKIEENGFAKKFSEILKNWKMILQQNFLRNLRMCELLGEWDWQRNFLYDVYALEYLRNMEEQPKSFLRRSSFINRSSMTQNKRTHLHFTCNRKWRKTVTYLRIVKIFVS